MAKIQALTESRIEELYKKSAMKADQRFKKGTSLPIPNLLIVDDDATVRQQLERLYTQKGYSVVAVSSAEEGISRFAEEDIDLAITDIKLPGMDGVQFISYIHENLYRTSTKTFPTCRLSPLQAIPISRLRSIFSNSEPAIW